MTLRRSRTSALIVALLALSAPAAADELAPTIAPGELHERQQKGTAPLVIDVRTPAEYAMGHVPGAVNIPHTELSARLGEVESESGVALYCLMGPRARLGEKTLREAGVRDILHLDGGLSAWREAGLPVESPGE